MVEMQIVRMVHGFAWLFGWRLKLLQTLRQCAHLLDCDILIYLLKERNH